MKKQTFKPLDKLSVDVLDYMFVEWLVRNSLYSKFVANLIRYHPDPVNPRSIIRDQIRRISRFPVFLASDLISSSFLFDKTPEGYLFWARVNSKWFSYLESFSKIL